MHVKLLTLAIAGVYESYGLKEKSWDFTKEINSATMGKVLSIYHVIRATAATVAKFDQLD